MPTIYEYKGFRAELADPQGGYREGRNPHTRVKKALERIAKTGKPPASRGGGFGPSEREGANAADYLAAMGERKTDQGSETYGEGRRATTVRWDIWSCGCWTNEGNLRKSCERHSRAFAGRCCVCGESDCGGLVDATCWSCRREARGGEYDLARRGAGRRGRVMPACQVCGLPSKDAICGPACKRLYLAAVSSGRLFYLWKRASQARWYLDDQAGLRDCLRAGLELLGELESWRVV